MPVKVNCLAVGEGCGLENSRSSEPILDHIAGDVGQPEVASLKAVGEFFVIHTKTVKHGGVQVIGMNRIFSHIPADFISFAVDVSAFKTAPRHEH